MKQIEKSVEIGGRKLTLSTGKLAGQANGAVLASYGETVVLATVVKASLREDLDYFPLTVDYQERLYAGGRIKGSRWVKREGKPTDEEILIGRLIDRSIRPLFPKTYKNEVQVIITVLSIDLENSPDIVAGVATSAAISASSIPWKGPAAILRVGMKEGAYFTNPTDPELPYSDLDLVLSLTRDSIVMVEAGAKEVSETGIIGAISYAQDDANKIISLIEDFAKAVGTEKEALPKNTLDLDLQKKVQKLAEEEIKRLLKTLSTKEGGYYEYNEVRQGVIASLPDQDKSNGASLFDDLFRSEVRKMILSGKRPDGRKTDEIRKISCEVGILPRTHGSAIFQRGQTQALTVTTLGSPSLEQLIESAGGEETKRYIHHYSMPPYATGETGRIGYPSRREIGHGALAERAILPVIPNEEVFPYTIRVVSEIMSSNGSTSMASVCGSTLSLMDAGVPIQEPVSGIAMGLVVDDKEKFIILSDIAGLEDGNGDMDFKVAGTKNGITALQLDVKTLSLTESILEKALSQAKDARNKILKVMIETLGEPRAKVSIYAPKIKMVKIPQEKIGELVGPGGRMIKRIIAETKAQVDVEDDGSVSVSGTSNESVDAAVKWIESLTKEVVKGEIYEGTVKRIQPFGAFVEILPGKEGLVHISDMAEEFVKDPSDKVSIGQRVDVRVKEIDELGRINLSMILDASRERPKGVRGDMREQGRRDFARPRFQRRRHFEKRDSHGPHFPASRLLNTKRDFSRE
ncbi:polyribonucleotide nucleotidyltransferase [Candidatus Woesebacteria bacterium]|nr:polyribonucleotide nucleotidyltransferase [Candidatus Woesebacteria bacterium]